MIEWIKHIVSEWKWDQGHIIATIAIPAFIGLLIYIIWDSFYKGKTNSATKKQDGSKK
jgi:hypothetical protein